MRVGDGESFFCFTEVWGLIVVSFAVDFFDGVDVVVVIFVYFFEVFPCALGDAGAKLHDGSSRYGHGGASFDVTVEFQPDGGDCLSFGDAFPYFAACDVDFCFEVFAVFYKFFIECVGDGESFFCLFEVFGFVVFAVFVDFLDAVNVEFTVRVVFFKAVPADLCDSRGEFLQGESGDGFCCSSFNATVQFEPDGGQMFCPATGEVFPDLVGCDGDP